MNTKDEAKTVGENFRKIRTGALWSMPDLAEEMKKRGHNWTKASVWKIETGDRRIKVDEAIDAFNIMGLDIPDAFARLAELSSVERRSRKACDSAIGVVEQMLSEKSQLEIALAEMDMILRANDPGRIDAEDEARGQTPENTAMPSETTLRRLREVEAALQLDKVGDFIKNNLSRYSPTNDRVEVIDGKLELLTDEEELMYSYYSSLGRETEEGGE